MTQPGDETTGDERIAPRASHVHPSRTMGKMSVRATETDTEIFDAARRRKAEREARLKSRTRDPVDDDDADQVIS